MKRKKRHLSAEFKATVASEALKGVRSVNDIAQQYEVTYADEVWCTDITYIPMPKE